MATRIFDLPRIDTPASETLSLQDPDLVSWTEAESTLLELGGSIGCSPGVQDNFNLGLTTIVPDVQRYMKIRSM